MNESVSMEKYFRYDCSGKWFKGSVHVHTTNSSGRLTVAETTAFYADAGYDFICITDKIAPFIGNSDDQYPLLVLDGMEVEGEDDQGSRFHVVCIEGVDGITGETKLTEAIQRVRAQGGILVWAHPYTIWTDKCRIRCSSHHAAWTTGIWSSHNKRRYKHLRL